MIAETDRHAGHADIVRELIDGEEAPPAKQRRTCPEVDDDWWPTYVDRVEQAAHDAQAAQVPGRARTPGRAGARTPMVGTPVHNRRRLETEPGGPAPCLTQWSNG